MTYIYPALSRRICLIAGLCSFGAFALINPAQGASWKDIQFGGFASQGYMVNSGHNDYFGDSSQGTFDFREYAVNASWSHGPWRIGAQVFGQKLGDYGDDEISLDWASVDYQPKQWLGFRVGRVKTPRGLYNESLDLDSVRPFVLLPQSVYDARLRDFNAAFNGGMVFGNVDLKKAGSLDYKAIYGAMPMSTDSGASAYFNNDAPLNNSRFEMKAVFGGTLFWNTPIAGLRTGYSYTAFQDFGADRIAGASVIARDTDLFQRHLLSVEYVAGNWTFAVEGGFDRAHFDLHSKTGAFPPPFTQDVMNYYGYLSAARRINSWLELGAYYSYSKDVTDTSTSMTFPTLVQNDYALSAKFDLTDHLIFKLEGHYMHGAGKLFNTADHPQPVNQRDTDWTVFAAKVTYSF